MLTKDENKVLKELQEGIPIEVEPFKVIADKCGIPEDNVLHIVDDLKSRKIIRRISPIYDTRMLGYDSALVALRIPSDKLEDAANIVSAHPGVSHNYERENELNLWFTLAIPPDSRFGLEKTIEALAENSGAEEYVIFRTKRLFKIGVKLDFEEGASLDKEDVETRSLHLIPLTEDEKEVIRITQQDIEIVSRPFRTGASSLGAAEDKVVSKLKEFNERGVMRRFAAILNHRKAGFLANGMMVSYVPLEKIEEIGNKIASYKAVSHCYERTSKPQWRYNFFAMIHGMNREEVERVVKEIVRENGLDKYDILYSSREFKKRRVRYFTEEFYNWESRHNLN